MMIPWNWTSPPGDTIANILEERQQTPEQLARALVCPLVYVERLLKGEEVIDKYMAEDLAKILGPTPEFWAIREQRYRGI